MAVSQVPLDQAMNMVKTSMKKALIDKIAKTLRDSVEPDIQMLATKTADELVRHAVWHYTSDMRNFDTEPNIYINVKFGKGD